MQTSTFNCPVCKQGNLVITEINDVSFDPNENQKINILGIAKCDNCNVKYELNGKDVTMR